MMFFFFLVYFIFSLKFSNLQLFIPLFRKLEVDWNQIWVSNQNGLFCIYLHIDSVSNRHTWRWIRRRRHPIEQLPTSWWYLRDWKATDDDGSWNFVILCLSYCSLKHEYHVGSTQSLKLWHKMTTTKTNNLHTYDLFTGSVRTHLDRKWKVSLGLGLSYVRLAFLPTQLFSGISSVMDIF